LFLLIWLLGTDQHHEELFQYHMAVDYAYVCPLVSGEEHSTVLAVLKNTVPVYRRLGLSEHSSAMQVALWLDVLHARLAQAEITQQGYQSREERGSDGTPRTRAAITQP
jgi:hypothetical protein